MKGFSVSLRSVNLQMLCYIIFFFNLHIQKLETAVNFKVIGPNQPIMAFVSKDALLHCHLSPSMSIEGMEVRWFRSLKFDAIVHLYQNGRDQDAQQMSEYQGRTEMLRNNFASGNVSLRIHNITPADEGMYNCFFQLNGVYEETMLELKVIGPGSDLHISVDSYQDGGIQLMCKSAGWYPEPTVLWRDQNGEHLPSLFETKSEKNDGLFEIQTSVIMTKRLKQNLTCIVGNPHLDQEKKATMYISDPFFLRGYPWMVALITILFILGFFLPLASYFFWKQHTEKGKLIAALGKIQHEFGTLQAELEWRKTQVFGEVNVTLDPDTAHPSLKLSDGQKTVTWEPKHQDLLDNPKRFDHVCCVLGTKGFTSGRIYWEVEGTGKIWAIGVARESVRRKGEIEFAPEEGIWAIEQNRNQYRALTTIVTPLPLNEKPNKIRIYVHYEEGQISFFNPANGDFIFHFRASFMGEKIFPFFWVNSQLRLNP